MGSTGCRSRPVWQAGLHIRGQPAYWRSSGVVQCGAFDLAVSAACFLSIGSAARHSSRHCKDVAAGEVV